MKYTLKRLHTKLQAVPQKLTFDGLLLEFVKTVRLAAHLLYLL